MGVDRLKQRLRVMIPLIILVIVGAGLGGLFLWARQNGLDNLVRTYALIKTQSLNRVDTRTLVDGAIKGMVDALGDPYSVYLDQEAFRELNQQIEGSFGGIGVEIDLNEEKQLVVVAPLPGTPADRAGLKSGDLIMEIDGKETVRMSLVEAARILRGKPGTSVLLKIRSPEKDRSYQVNLVRRQISIPSVTGKMLPDQPGIGYLQVMQFNQLSTMPQLQQELTKIEKAGYRGLIIDLRGNPGGDLQTAVELASYFIKRGPVVRIVHQGGTEDVWQPRPVSSRVKAPLVVLVNEGSASASEIVAGAIKDTGSGKLVGTHTFGKGLVQTVFNLEGGTGVKLTTDRYLTPNGHDINKKGIEPDIVVEQPNGTESDLQLIRAVKVLNEQLGRAGEQAA